MPLKGWIAWTVLLCAPTALACTCRNDFPMSTHAAAIRPAGRFSQPGCFTCSDLWINRIARRWRWQSCESGTGGSRGFGRRLFFSMVAIHATSPWPPETTCWWRAHASRSAPVLVNGCSGTRSLSTAAVDLRTLDGARCSGSGGSLLGIGIRQGPSRVRCGAPFHGREWERVSRAQRRPGSVRASPCSPGPVHLGSDAGSGTMGIRNRDGCQPGCARRST